MCVQHMHNHIPLHLSLTRWETLVHFDDADANIGIKHDQEETIPTIPIQFIYIRTPSPFPHTQESCKWDPSAANGNGIVCSRQLLPPRAKVWKAWLVRSRLVHFLLGKFDVHSSLLEKTSQWGTLEASKSVYIILYNIYILSAPLLDIVSAATLDSWPFPSTPHFWF